MPPNPVEFLLRIRRVAEDEAKRKLAEGIAEEARTRQRVADAEALINREGEIATDLAMGDGAVEAYAAWLPVGRKQAAAARAAHENAVATVLLARTALQVAYAAAEAAAGFLERQSDAASAAAAKRAQNALDETAPHPDRVNQASP